MNQVDLDNWEKMYDSFYICEFPFSVGEFEEKYSINFEVFLEDGLGEVFYAVISINNSLYMFRGFSDKTQKRICVCAYIPCNSRNPEHLLEQLLFFLNLPESSLKHREKDLSPPKWVLVLHN